MPRALLLSTLLLAALVGCQREEGGYSDVSVRVEAGAVNLFIRGRRHGDERHPCPPSLLGSARVNGVAMQTVDNGAIEWVPDSDEMNCLGLWYQLNLERLPADSEMLDITFDPLHLYGGAEYTEARTWHVTADWGPARVWTEDDLAARMRANEEFEVRWEPEHTLVPELELRAYDRGYWGVEVEAIATLVSEEPGSARFRFHGPEPSALWNVTAALPQQVLGVTLCGGFERCKIDAHGRASLQPGGIPPTMPDGVAPPRACIAAPGADGSRYRSPYWFRFPDLSMLQVARHMSCAGADFYFVVLGACGVCGGGNSTYVVANRGTQAASFRVRSNQETVDGTVLEPQQLSAPFEISFEGALSRIEILSDADCDATSNSAWVASVVCEHVETNQGALPAADEEDCNNSCGL